MSVWLQDIRFAVRSLWKSPGFSAVVLLTLALGIGANTAIFSVIEGVLLRPLPFDTPSRLVMVWENDRLRGTTQERFSVPDFFDLAERNEVFDDLALYQTPSFTLTSADAEPMRVNVSTVSANFFTVLGVAPEIGRAFYPEEDAPGGDRVVVLGQGVWHSRFGGSHDIVGRDILLDGVATRVVGVMRASFAFPRSAELWIPAQMTPTSRPRGNHGFGVVARLKESRGLTEANANVETIAAALETEFLDDNEGRGMWVQSIYESTTGSVRTPLLVLLGVAATVLLIACVNVANLLYARTLSREQELAIRTAMGAGRRTLLRQSLTESLILSVAGGCLGIGLAQLSHGALLATVPAGLPRLDNVSLNATVVGFALLLSALSGIVFGMLPAARVSRGNLVSSLREGTGAGRGVGAHRAQSGLVVVQIALAVVLVIGAGLLISSFSRLLSVEPGFAPSRLVSVNVQLPASRYPQGFADWPNLIEVRQFQTELLERGSDISIFDNVAIAAYGPLNAGFTSRFTIEGRPEVAPGQQDEVRIRVVSPSYFRTAGIPILSGRPLEPSDERADAPPVIAINEAFAKRYFIDENPIGARLTQWNSTREIVAVVGDVKFQGLAAETPPAIYPLFSQAPFSGFSLLARTSAEPEASYERLRELVWSIDRDLAMTSFTTLSEALAGSVASERFTMWLFGLFAALALLLASLGIYGVISYSVGERTHEIGVRMSLGAGRSQVLRLVMTQGARLAGLGILSGVAVALFAGRAIESLLFDVGRFDPVVFATVAALAAVVALGASYLPAARATRVNPISTLRQN